MFIFLYSSPFGKISLLLPDGSIQGNPWNGGDTMTYVNPAKAFLQSRVFARNGQPDAHRTIGYPFFLAMMMYVFGADWLQASYICQFFIFSLYFPAATYIAYSLCPEITRRDVWNIFIILLLSGAGTAYVGQIMTDQIFSSLLMSGIACGFAAVRKLSLKMMLLHILLVGCAAQIRPVLGFFFIVNGIFYGIHHKNTWK
ncbi:hypothetical protein VU07_00440 [Desulfobulbus sp. F4]|nr:hypothetical protein [Desulfobulbus sp. F4]